MYELLRLRPARMSVAFLVALTTASSLAVAALSPTVEAGANKMVVGQGSTSQFSCTPGVTGPANIGFNATRSKGTMSGSAFIGNGTDLQWGFLVVSGTVNNSSYSLQGVHTGGECGGVFTQTVANATVSGRCGSNVVMHYSDTSGAVGDFTGSVACA